MRTPKDEAPTLAGDEASKSNQTSYRKNDMVNFNSLAESPALVPIFAGTINSQSVQLCDARTLHTFMGVLRDFSNWIKGRIRKFEFVNGVDFLAISRSPELASGNRGAAINYHLTLDMAKELAMVENNPKGREARRYFIDCEKRALATLTAPTHARITTAQAQHLKELVHLVAESGRQTYGETWERLHRKMKVNSYLELAASQFDEACNYLRGKMDDTSTAALIQKHFPGNALMVATPAPDADRTASAFMASQSVAAQVQKSVFKAILAGGDDWKHQRWLVSFIADSKMAIPAVVDKLPSDTLVVSPDDVAGLIMRNKDSPFDNEQVLKIAQLSALRMMGEVVRINMESDIERLKKQIRKLHITDLLEVGTQAWMELSMRPSRPETNPAITA